MKKAVKRKKLKLLSWYKDRAWKVFSRYIRKRDKGVCFTCGIQKGWWEMDAGHFKHGRIDFDDRNIHAQCARCNRFLHGNLSVYAHRLIQEYGGGIVEYLTLESNKPIKYTREGLTEIYEKYKDN